MDTFGITLLKEKEWKQVLKHVKYTGDYDFVNAKVLNLVSKQKVNSDIKI